eukprot:gene13754-11220_t
MRKQWRTAERVADAPGASPAYARGIERTVSGHGGLSVQL